MRLTEARVLRTPCISPMSLQVGVIPDVAGGMRVEGQLGFVGAEIRGRWYS